MSQPDPSIPPLLIALTQGLNVSGVTTWGVTLANALAARGGAVGLIVHPEPPGQARLDRGVDPRVEVTRLEGVPPMDLRSGDLSPYMPAYRGAIRRLGEHAGWPVVFSPNLAGNCYGLAAAIASSDADRVRVVGWQHSDTDFDTDLLENYEPMVSRFVAVSRRIERTLRGRLGRRGAHVRRIPYGVDVPEAPARREPLSGRPLRLIYTGRMDHFQKRVLALPMLAETLSRRGLDVEVTLVGDGSAQEEVDGACAGLPNARRVAGAPPSEVARLLDEHDALVLPSRFEGLSVSMLEAMARGCVPIVTRIPSGATEAIEHGETGLLVEVGGQAERDVADALAHEIERLLRGDAANELARLSERCRAVARERYSVEAHADAVVRALRECAGDEPRYWPADRPASFAGSMSVLGAPTNAPMQTRRALDRIREQRGGRAKVALWGGGQHTAAIGWLCRPPVEVVAVVDDKPETWGQDIWGLPVVGAQELEKMGVTDVLISSWCYQELMYSRRERFEPMGIRVHRLYGEQARQQETRVAGAAAG